eukprot:284408-Prymnesium_polylepis.3
MDYGYIRPPPADAVEHLDQQLARIGVGWERPCKVGIPGNKRSLANLKSQHRNSGETSWYDGRDHSQCLIGESHRRGPVRYLRHAVDGPVEREGRAHRRQRGTDNKLRPGSQGFPPSCKSQLCRRPGVKGDAAKVMASWNRRKRGNDCTIALSCMSHTEDCCAGNLLPLVRELHPGCVPPVE